MRRKISAVHRCDCCDEVLSTSRQYCDDRCKYVHDCMKVGVTKYKHKVAIVFQAMIRAEAGADESPTALAVVNGELKHVPRKRGQCVCVTCGRVCPWRGGQGMFKLDSGHFLGGRGSILFEETCVAPQCSGCNKYGSGKPQEYRRWMEAVYGIEEIERLEFVRRQPLSRTRDQLVDMRIQFDRRLKAAELKMKGH